MKKLRLLFLIIGLFLFNSALRPDTRADLQKVDDLIKSIDSVDFAIKGKLEWETNRDFILPILNKGCESNEAEIKLISYGLLNKFLGKLSKDPTGVLLIDFAKDEKLITFIDNTVLKRELLKEGFEVRVQILHIIKTLSYKGLVNIERAMQLAEEGFSVESLEIRKLSLFIIYNLICGAAKGRGFEDEINQIRFVFGGRTSRGSLVTADFAKKTILSERFKNILSLALISEDFELKIITFKLIEYLSEVDISSSNYFEKSDSDELKECKDKLKEYNKYFFTEAHDRFILIQVDNELSSIEKKYITEVFLRIVKNEIKKIDIDPRVITFVEDNCSDVINSKFKLYCCFVLENKCLDEAFVFARKILKNKKGIYSFKLKAPAIELLQCLAQKEYKLEDIRNLALEFINDSDSEVKRSVLIILLIMISKHFELLEDYLDNIVKVSFEALKSSDVLLRKSAINLFRCFVEKNVFVDSAVNTLALRINTIDFEEDLDVYSLIDTLLPDSDEDDSLFLDKNTIEKIAKIAKKSFTRKDCIEMIEEPYCSGFKQIYIFDRLFKNGFGYQKAIKVISQLIFQQRYEYKFVALTLAGMLLEHDKGFQVIENLIGVVLSFEDDLDGIRELKDYAFDLLFELLEKNQSFEFAERWAGKYLHYLYWNSTAIKIFCKLIEKRYSLEETKVIWLGGSSLSTEDEDDALELITQFFTDRFSCWSDYEYTRDLKPIPSDLIDVFINYQNSDDEFLKKVSDKVLKMFREWLDKNSDYDFEVKFGFDESINKWRWNSYYQAIAEQRDIAGEFEED